MHIDQRGHGCIQMDQRGRGWMQTDQRGRGCVWIQIYQRGQLQQLQQTLFLMSVRIS
jgi:hypothetical protein